MADKDIIIGRVINVTGMVGVSAGIVLFAFGIVFLLFRHVFLVSMLESSFSGFGSWRGDRSAHRGAAVNAAAQ